MKTLIIWNINISNKLKLLKDSKAMTALEYAMIAGAIVVVIVIAFKALGLKISDVITAVTNAI